MRRLLVSGLLLAMSVTTALAAHGALTTAPSADGCSPTNPIYVAKSGNDTTGSGSAARPYLTITKATSVASTTRNVIYVGAGTYRESIGKVFKKIELCADPASTAAVEVTGATAITSWTQATAGVWQSSGWTFQPLCRDATVNEVAAGDSHMRAPEQLFADNTAVTQFSTLGELDTNPNGFFVDRTNDVLYTNVDPTGRAMEASTKEFALVLSTGSSNSRVRGINFSKFASSKDSGCNPATVTINNSTGVVFENNSITQSSSSGLAVYGPAAVVTDNLIIRNGNSGITANLASDSVFDTNVITFNNSDNFVTLGTYGAVAGAKITRSSNVLVINNYVADNNSVGLWCDLQCRNGFIARNHVARNAKHGIYYEISDHGVIFSNVIYSNGQLGLRLSGAHDTTVLNNTVAGNSSHQIEVSEDPEVAPTTRCPLAGDCDSYGNSITNNLISNFGPSTAMHLNTTGNAAAVTQISSMDHNAWNQPGLPTLIHWRLMPFGANDYANLATFKSGYPAYEANGTTAVSSGIADPAGGDFRATSDLANAGTPIDPAVLAKAMIASSGNPVGAIEYFGLPVAAPTTTQAPTTTLPPETTTVPPVTTTLPPETTTVPPVTTTLPPETTTVPPVTTTLPPETTTVPPETTTSPPETTTSPVVRPVSFCVNAGGPTYTRLNRTVCAADDGTNFLNGTVTSTDRSEIGNTLDDKLYRTQRNAVTRFAALAPARTYAITLSFAELDSRAGSQRKFDVYVEGQLVLDDFSAYSAAGNRYYQAVDVTVTVPVTDGELNISFVKVGSTKYGPRVAAIAADSI